MHRPGLPICPHVFNEYDIVFLLPAGGHVGRSISFINCQKVRGTLLNEGRNLGIVSWHQKTTLAPSIAAKSKQRCQK
jgi:hypothetical protein